MSVVAIADGESSRTEIRGFRKWALYSMAFRDFKFGGVCLVKAVKNISSFIVTSNVT
jgi:hypothetical protein